jgi:hypothetical protein
VQARGFPEIALLCNAIHGLTEILLTRVFGILRAQAGAGGTVAAMPGRRIKSPSTGLLPGNIRKAPDDTP